MASPANARSPARGTPSASLVAPIERTILRRSMRRAALLRCILACLAMGVVVAGCAAPTGRPVVLDQAYTALEAARGDPRVRALAPGRLDEAESALADAYLAWQRGASGAEVEQLALHAEERAALARSRARELVAQARPATRSAALGWGDLEPDAPDGGAAGPAPIGDAGPAVHGFDTAAATRFGGEDGKVVPAAARSP